MKKIIITLVIVFLFGIPLYAAEWVMMRDKDKCNAGRISVLDSTDIMVAISHDSMVEIWKSTDGAETWEVIYSEYGAAPWPDPQFIFSFGHPVKNYIYMLRDNATSSNSQIHISKDECLTFDTIYFPDKQNPLPFIISAKMYDDLVGSLIILGKAEDGKDYVSSNAMAYTEDGWQTWKMFRVDTIFNRPIAWKQSHFFSPTHFGFFALRGSYKGLADCSFYYMKDRRNMASLYY